MVTRAWKVYGLNEHRQKVSFQKSCQYDFSNEKDGTKGIQTRICQDR